MKRGLGSHCIGGYVTLTGTSHVVSTGKLNNPNTKEGTGNDRRHDQPASPEAEPTMYTMDFFPSDLIDDEGCVGASRPVNCPIRGATFN